MVGTVVIKRVFNNNVAMVTSDDGSELIVIGRGLCFGRHAGDAIDDTSVEKTYALQEGTSQDSRTIDRLAHLFGVHSRRQPRDFRGHCSDAPSRAQC